MPHFALTRLVGTGGDDDPYRPPTDQTFSIVDLRPDASRVDGWALVGTPARETGMGAYLGDSAAEVNPGLVRSLQARLGIAVDGDGTLGGAVADLLTAKARTDGTRWRPLRPRRGRASDGSVVDRWDVHLGGECIWRRETPALAGGATIYESFNKSGSTTVGPLLTWVEKYGNWRVSNSHLASDFGQASVYEGLIYADHPLASDDHYVEITVLDGSGYSSGVAARVRTSGVRHYYYCDYRDNSNTIRLMKRVESTLSTIGAESTSIGLPVRVRMEVSGSQLAGFLDSNLLLTATDTSLVGFNHAGVKVGDDTFNIWLDDFEAGDLQSEQSMDGSVAPAGELLKTVPRGLGGTTTPMASLSVLKVVERTFASSITPGGDLPGAVPAKTLTGTTLLTGAIVRQPRRTLRGLAAPVGTLGTRPHMMPSGQVAPVGDATLVLLGRVFGQPGIARVRLTRAGEALARVRRG